MRPRGRGRWHRGDKLHWRSHQCSRCSHRRSTHLHRRSDSHHACHGMSHHSDMHWASARTRPHFLCSIDLKEKKKLVFIILKCYWMIFLKPLSERYLCNEVGIGSCRCSPRPHKHHRSGSCGLDSHRCWSHSCGLWSLLDWRGVRTNESKCRKALATLDCG